MAHQYHIPSSQWPISITSHPHNGPSVSHPILTMAHQYGVSPHPILTMAVFMLPTCPSMSLLTCPSHVPPCFQHVPLHVPPCYSHVPWHVPPSPSMHVTHPSTCHTCFPYRLCPYLSLLMLFLLPLSLEPFSWQLLECLTLHKNYLSSMKYAKQIKLPMTSTPGMGVPL